MKVGCPTVGLFEHLFPVELEKLLVLLWSPGERVNPVETKNVVDPKNPETVTSGANPPAPPVEIAPTHFFPVINWNAPVLSPFLGKLIVLKVSLGWRASAPIEHELLTM